MEAPGTAPAAGHARSARSALSVRAALLLSCAVAGCGGDYAVSIAESDSGADAGGASPSQDAAADDGAVRGAVPRDATAGAPSDATTTDAPGICYLPRSDTSSCTCNVTPSGLEMSLECFCADGRGCPCTVADAIGSHACLEGLASSVSVADSCETVVFFEFGFETWGWHYDSRTGELVGARSITDHTPITCPFDPNIVADSTSIYATSGSRPSRKCSYTSCVLCPSTAEFAPCP